MSAESQGGAGRRPPAAFAVVPLLLALVGSSAAEAAEAEWPDQRLKLEIHGFVSQGALKSTANDYLATSHRGSFDFTEMGVNFTTQPTERLRIGMQLFAFKLGALGNFNAKADWYYLDYRLRDWLGFRAGRLKLPFGLYNDTRDIDAVRAPILLPASVYSATDRDFFLAQTGMEIYGYRRLGKAGALDYRVYGGTIYIPIPSQTGMAAQVLTLGVPFMGGARLMWETPIEGLRVGGSVLAGRLEASYFLPAPLPILTARSLIYLGLGSLEYAAHDVLLAAEYGQRHSETSSSDPMLVPAATVNSENLYGLAAYRVKSWLQPAVYYSLYYPNRQLRSGRENFQHDVSATLRFDINHYWLVKVEGHYMRGTAVLTGTAAMAAAATESWGLFLLKATAFF